MKKDLGNFSTDLFRISYWILAKNSGLVKKFLQHCYKAYSDVGPKIGCYQNIWQELKKIENLQGGRLKSAERALTASRILFFQAQR